MYPDDVCLDMTSDNEGNFFCAGYSDRFLNNANHMKMSTEKYY